MKSKMKRRMLAIVLCMVIVLSNSSFIFASSGTEEPAAVAQEGDPQNVQETQTEAAVQDTPAVLSETTPEATPEATPEPTQVPAVTAEPTEAPQATAEPTQAPEVTAAPEATPAPTETPAVTAEPTQAPEITPTPTPEVTAAPEATPVPTEIPVNEVQQAEPQPYHAVYQDDTITITVSAEAGIVPEGAELKVTPIEKKEITSSMTEEEKAEAEAVNNQYDLTEKKLTEDSEANDTMMQGFLAYDISFLVNGQETEPNGDVKVVMDFKEAAVPEGVSEDADVAVKHLKEEIAAEDGVVVENITEKSQLQANDKAEVDKVELVSNNFSIFTLSWENRKAERATFYYIYIRPNDSGGYQAEKIWSGDDFADNADIRGLVQYEEKNRLKERFGFGTGDESLSHNQNLSVGYKSWDNVEFVGGRVYEAKELDKENFSNIHQQYKIADYIKSIGRGAYGYSTGTSGDFEELTDDDAVVLLFADRLDYTRADDSDYEKALENGEITDYSERLKGDSEVQVDIHKSAEWADYYERIAEVSFTVNGTPKVDPLDIVLVIDTSYSMDFSNYDWDYMNCSTDTSNKIQYGRYNRYDRFFDGADAPNKLNGTSRMEDTKNAAYSFITTFMKNNSEVDEKNRTRIAVVSFNEEAKIETGFTDDFNEAIQSVENLATYSGTNTGDAIEKANQVLKSKKSGRKCITVVLSDGAPNKDDSDFSTQLNKLKNATDAVYTIGVDLDDTTKITGSNTPGNGSTPKKFLESIADSGCAFNMTSGQNTVASCFEHIIEDLTVAAKDAVIHDIVGEFFEFSSEQNSDITHEEKKVSIKVGDINVIDNTVQFKIKLDDNKKNIVDSYLTNQNNPDNDKDVYIEYKIDHETKNTPVIEQPQVSVYTELVIQYYYETANGELVPVKNSETGENFEKKYVDQAINSLAGIDEYVSYDRLTSEEIKNGYTLTDDVKKAGYQFIGQMGYPEIDIQSSLGFNDDKYQFETDNSKNVIKVIYKGDPTTSVKVKKEWKLPGDNYVHPSNVTVELIATVNGETVTLPSNITKEAILDENNKWEYNFSNLPLKDDKGQEIKYSVIETKVGTLPTEESSYDSKVTGDAENGFTITNTLIDFWYICKVSSTDEIMGLEGALFTLTEEATGKKYFGKSYSSGPYGGQIAWFENETDIDNPDKVLRYIPDGVYILEETQAPVGYQKSNVTWTITITNLQLISIIDNNTGKEVQRYNPGTRALIREYHFLNDPLYDLPSAGGSGIFWYLISGTAFLMAASLILYRMKRKEVLRR